MKEYFIPYGEGKISVRLPEEQVLFTGELQEPQVLPNWKNVLLDRLDVPTAGPCLRDIIGEADHVVILVEDNTRHTPVREILPLLCRYIVDCGCELDQITVLVCPGTHRILTDSELREKLGHFAMEHLKICQHNYRDSSALLRLHDVDIGGMTVPVFVNKIAADPDVLIGLGSIVPHPNAGFSGGAKILCPGCCGKETVSAMHTAAALMGYLPLGMEENDCRRSIERVAEEVGLDFIVNTILDANNQVVGIVSGDYKDAQRAGTQIARKTYGVLIPEPADILISCSYPYSNDYWQCEKALISGYFAVKEGGTIIFPAPCMEGMASNHDDLIELLSVSSSELADRIREVWNNKENGDLVSMGIALGAVTVREKADIFLYSSGISEEQAQKMQYRYFTDLQLAIDTALEKKTCGTIGILPNGGNSLPYL